MVATQVFKALGDPIRLEMLQRLSSGSSCTINSVSSQLGISRQGARKHLDVLVDAKLVSLQPKGRNVIVELDVRSLGIAKQFILQLEKQWDQRLVALKCFVEEGTDTISSS